MHWRNTVPADCKHHALIGRLGVSRNLNIWRPASPNDKLQGVTSAAEWVNVEITTAHSDAGRMG